MATQFEVTNSIARTYGEALLDLAAERKAEVEIESQLIDLMSLWRSDSAFSALMNSVAIDADARGASLRKIFQGRVDEMVLNLVLVLNHRGRTMLFPQICDAYFKQLDVQQGRQRVFVTTAVALTDDIRNKLLEEAGKMTGRTPVLEERIDPALIGGLQVQIGDRVIDTSLRLRIRRMRRDLSLRMEHHLLKSMDRFVSGNPA